MKLSGYSNPLHGMERRMSAGFPQREFRDPGLGSLGRSGGAGLGSLKHTMPHLQHLSGMRMQAGGAIDPVGQIYAASRPNLYNPDPLRRRVLDALRQTPMINRAMFAMPGTSMQFPYAQGGQAPPDPEELMEPEEEQSPGDDELRQIVMEAMAALEGQSRDPERALAHFIDAFGPRALADLQQMVERKHEEEEEGEEEEEQEGEGEEGGGAPGAPGGGVPEGEEEEPEMAGAGGGLLHGHGTGQSDEIEGTTPSGRPVLLSDGEYVIDAPTVAALGDGSTAAGARRLDQFRKQVRTDAYGHNRQAKPMKKGGSALVVRLK